MSGMKKTVLVDSKERTNPSQVATFLRELADRIDETKKRGRLKKSLEVEIEWYEGGDAADPVELG